MRVVSNFQNVTALRSHGAKTSHRLNPRTRFGNDPFRGLDAFIAASLAMAANRDETPKKPKEESLPPILTTRQEPAEVLKRKLRKLLQDNPFSDEGFLGADAKRYIENERVAALSQVIGQYEGKPITGLDVLRLITANWGNGYVGDSYDYSRFKANYAEKPMHRYADNQIPSKAVFDKVVASLHKLDLIAQHPHNRYDYRRTEKANQLLKLLQDEEDGVQPFVASGTVDKVKLAELKALLKAYDAGVTGWDVLQALYQVEQNQQFWKKWFYKGLTLQEFQKQSGQITLPSEALHQLELLGFLEKQTSSNYQVLWRVSKAGKALLEKGHPVEKQTVSKEELHELLEHFIQQQFAHKKTVELSVRRFEQPLQKEQEALYFLQQRILLLQEEGQNALKDAQKTTHSVFRKELEEKALRLADEVELKLVELQLKLQIVKELQLQLQAAQAWQTQKIEKIKETIVRLKEAQTNLTLQEIRKQTRALQQGGSDTVADADAASIKQLLTECAASVSDLEAERIKLNLQLQTADQAVLSPEERYRRLEQKLGITHSDNSADVKEKTADNTSVLDSALEKQAEKKPETEAKQNKTSDTKTS